MICRNPFKIRFIHNTANNTVLEYEEDISPENSGYILNVKASIRDIVESEEMINYTKRMGVKWTNDLKALKVCISLSFTHLHTHTHKTLSLSLRGDDQLHQEDWSQVDLRSQGVEGLYLSLSLTHTHTNTQTLSRTRSLSLSLTL